MPTIQESELGFGDVSMCVECSENEGAIWLCGEGMMCESCFALAADIPEEDAFGEIDFETKAKARIKLSEAN